MRDLGFGVLIMWNLLFVVLIIMVDGVDVEWKTRKEADFGLIMSIFNAIDMLLKIWKIMT